MKRRDFIRNTAFGVAIPSLLNGIPIKALAGTPLMNSLGGFMNDSKVLVLVQLAGGNDGKGNKMAAILSEAKAMQAIEDGVAKKGF